MHYEIVFITNESLIIPNNAIIIANNFRIIDDNSLIYDNENIYFDYLITDNLEVLKDLKVLFEHKKAIVNSNFMTSQENIFAFGKAILSNKDYISQVKTILESL